MDSDSSATSPSSRLQRTHRQMTRYLELSIIVLVAQPTIHELHRRGHAALADKIETKLSSYRSEHIRLADKIGRKAAVDLQSFPVLLENLSDKIGRVVILAVLAKPLPWENWNARATRGLRFSPTEQSINLFMACNTGLCGDDFGPIRAHHA